MEPKGNKREPIGAKMEPKGNKKVQTGAKGTPKGPQMEPKGAQRDPKGSQREPKGGQREPKGSQMVSKMHPKNDQSSISEKGRQKVSKTLPKFMILGAFFSLKIHVKINAKNIPNKSSWKILKMTRKLKEH